MTIGVHGGLPLDPEAAAQAFAEGSSWAATAIWRYRTGLTDEQTFAVERHHGVHERRESQRRRRRGQAIARGVNFARDLVNGPGYAMTRPGWPKRRSASASGWGSR